MENLENSRKKEVQLEMRNVIRRSEQQISTIREAAESDAEAIRKEYNTGVLATLDYRTNKVQDNFIAGLISEAEAIKQRIFLAEDAKDLLID